MKKKVAIIGLGYVGLPLALLAEKKGYSVIGIDKSKNKLKMLSSRVSPINDPTSSMQLQESNIEFTDDFSVLKDVSIAIICVPTPVDENKNPDLTMVKSAVLGSVRELPHGSLLIVESTINPGVCDEVLIPIIEKETNHKIGKTLFLAHCPERINPGDTKWHVGNINRVIGGYCETSLDKASVFYESIIEAKIKKMASLKEAEAVKIVENSFRDINIAFVNELAMSFNKLGINVKNVIDGAATKPFAFMAHYPGIGVGGHCIPVDPYYLIEYARGNGFEHLFLSLARSINENMPLYCVDRVEEALIEHGDGGLKDKEVGVLGLSYKANVGDDRESPSKVLVDELLRRGARVHTYDPYFLEKSTAKSVNELIENKQVVFLATAHNEFKKIKPEFMATDSIFFDGRNLFIDKTHIFIDNQVRYISI